MSFLEACFSMPALPATVLLIVALAYWVCVSLGAFELETVDLDPGADAGMGGEDSLLSLGLTPLRLLNIGYVPLMLWLSFFAMAWWFTSLAVRDWAVQGQTLRMVQAVALTVGISLIVTKAVTQPMRGWFGQTDLVTAEDLIGRVCTVTTLEATDAYGQARYETGAAPLLLQIRCREGALAKGDAAEIIDYDPARRVYLVRSVNTVPQ